MWGPVLAWCVLELLAESIDAENPDPVALDLFDRLRLREPFAQAFTALGFEGEEGWRVAARIKVVLLSAAGVGKPEEMPAEVVPAAEKIDEERNPAASGSSTDTEPASFTDAAYAADNLDSSLQPCQATTLAVPQLLQSEGGAFAPDASLSPLLWPALWLDSDLRWLTGVHSAEGHDYLVRERYEELLWWLLLPSLLRLAGEALPSRAAITAMSTAIHDALAAAESADYRIDLLLAPAADEQVFADPASKPIAKAPPLPLHKGTSKNYDSR
jgi:hypothetical protein